MYKRQGWLAPSIENRIQAHWSRIEAVLKLYPVTKIVVETASFDIQKIKHPAIEGSTINKVSSLVFGMCVNMFFIGMVTSANTAKASPKTRFLMYITLKVAR